MQSFKTGTTFAKHLMEYQKIQLDLLHLWSTCSIVSYKVQFSLYQPRHFLIPRLLKHSNNIHCRKPDRYKQQQGSGLITIFIVENLMLHHLLYQNGCATDQSVFVEIVEKNNYPLIYTGPMSMRNCSPSK